MSLVVDAHQHVWDRTKARYDWLGPDLPEIDRSIFFDELRPQLRAAGVDATVLVQSADEAADTDEMLRVAAANPEIAGVVVYVPLERPQEAHDRLAELRRDLHVVGVRNLIHDQPDPDWILRPDVDEGLGVLEAAGVPFDYVAVLPRHLAHLPVLAERHPQLSIVIDHLSKPPIGLGSDEPWRSLIARAAENPRVVAKVSGLYSATRDAASWTTGQLVPVVEHALACFGAERLMYGGDWPVSLTAGGYARVWAALHEVTADWSEADSARLWGGTAREFYRLDESLVAGALAASA
ncbi:MULTISPECIES: amidohydrolase family protein [unclassified Rathayibacter]|uniref:amidohydrolase family protein n=1 Tax=unclassified Rathayibacter TaxID=2609250 RepID=UPI0007019AEC|nr:MULTISPECIES: amidohydrolase family protein [unclassified Rathayibacter]KQQ05458.1 metal-dependent hydrolase [Rathayibacter sp. Leaf294]KQS13321.1 metal-dependent hydrolase [Rathayibacter sp. Leaf185]